MTAFQPSDILEEVNNLVSVSCNECSGSNSAFNSLHKGIIKIYFEARKVEIDYQKSIITAEIPMSARDYTTVSFECPDMETFLRSCIKKDKRSLNYYRNVLAYYSLHSVA